MEANRSPGLGQEALAIERPPVNLNARKAVGGMLKPEDYGIELSSLAGIKAEDINRVQTDTLYSYIYPEEGVDERPIPNLIVAYGVGRIIVSPAEYITIVRSPEGFEKDVYNKSTSKNAISSNTEYTQDKAGQAVVHAIENKVEVGEGLLRGYKKEQARLTTLLQKTRYRGYAHMNRAELGMLMTAVLEITFKNTLATVGVSRYWDDATYVGADKAMKASLFTGPQNNRIHYLEQMLKLSITYNQDKMSLLKLRLKQINKRKKKYILSDQIFLSVE